jgi:hypothetical protein
LVQLDPQLDPPRLGRHQQGPNQIGSLLMADTGA